jgi:thioredoxin reductase (NADPH)
VTPRAPTNHAHGSESENRTALTPAVRPARGRPVIIVADEDGEARDIIVTGLRRRYAVDYDIRVVDSPDAGTSDLRKLVDDGRDIALLIATQILGGQDGLLFMARTRAIRSTARRLILTSMGDFSAVRMIARASTLGEIDYQATRPSSAADEQFLATVGEILADWAAEHRRVEPGLTIVSEGHAADVNALWDILDQWNFTPKFVDATSPEGQAMVDGLDLAHRLPAVVLPDGQVLERPTAAEVADAFGWNREELPDPLDIVVLGSGPAGLSAALNAGSEGLRTLLVEPGTGQASASPMLRNYMGFTAGISGAELTRRGWRQALWFGVHMRIGRPAIDIRAEAGALVVRLEGGGEARTKSVVVATGLAYRRIGIPSVDHLVGRGVFYGSGATVASTMAGEPVAVIGGANSAAEAAVYLARFASRVTVLVRGSSVTDSMSDYLIQQLDSLPNVEVRLSTEVIEAEDEQQLRALTVGNNATGTISRLDAVGLFILIGFAPRTDWLPQNILRDERGFVLTGDDARSGDGRDARHRLAFETSMAGVFAVGDVRHGSVKRIAAAVGEGASATQEIHRYLSVRPD